jgi:hypothetical protein
MSDKIDNVSVGKKANVFFDGKCVSHSVFFPDGSRKTVGVVLPNSKLTFNVSTPELMEICGGTCQVKIAGESSFKTYAEGSSFSVATNGSFDIHTGADAAHYVCSFG